MHKGDGADDGTDNGFLGLELFWDGEQGEAALKSIQADENVLPQVHSCLWLPATRAMPLTGVLQDHGAGAAVARVGASCRLHLMAKKVSSTPAACGCNLSHPGGPTSRHTDTAWPPAPGRAEAPCPWWLRANGGSWGGAGAAPGEAAWRLACSPPSERLFC